MAKAKQRSAESFRYILKADRDLSPDQQTVFTLNPLTGAERARLVDEAVVTRTMPDGTKTAWERTHQQSREVALGHLIAIDNFPVGAPKSWPVKRSEQEAYLELLADDDIVEISTALFQRSWLGDDAKNSSSPEPTSGSGAP